MITIENAGFKITIEAITPAIELELKETLEIDKEEIEEIKKENDRLENDLTDYRKEREELDGRVEELEKMLSEIYEAQEKLPSKAKKKYLEFFAASVFQTMSDGPYIY